MEYVFACSFYIFCAILTQTTTTTTTSVINEADSLCCATKNSFTYFQRCIKIIHMQAGKCSCEQYNRLSNQKKRGKKRFKITMCEKWRVCVCICGIKAVKTLLMYCSWKICIHFCNIKSFSFALDAFSYVFTVKCILLHYIQWGNVLLWFLGSKEAVSTQKGFWGSFFCLVGPKTTVWSLSIGVKLECKARAQNLKKGAINSDKRQFLCSLFLGHLYMSTKGLLSLQKGLLSLIKVSGVAFTP